jgi:hypothetical protein
MDTTHSEPSERGEGSESLNAHWLGGDQFDDCTVTGLEELRSVLECLSRASADLCNNKLAKMMDRKVHVPC